MNLALWDPFKTADTFDRMVGSVLGPNVSRQFAEEARNWHPAADLASDESGYTIRFDVPGVPKDAIEIDVDERVLRVSGERSNSFENDETKNVYRRETFYGKFSRAFRLPEDADAERIEASYADGVLEVRVPKSQQAQARRIEIGTK